MVTEGVSGDSGYMGGEVLRLCKGGAQAGVENMKIMCGLERTAGLSRRGLHP
jgi:N-acetyl-gamma-glutamylphosphate reductase